MISEFTEFPEVTDRVSGVTTRRRDKISEEGEQVPLERVDSEQDKPVIGGSNSRMEERDCTGFEEQTPPTIWNH